MMIPLYRIIPDHRIRDPLPLVTGPARSLRALVAWPLGHALSPSLHHRASGGISSRSMNDGKLK